MDKTKYIIKEKEREVELLSELLFKITKCKYPIYVWTEKDGEFAYTLDRYIRETMDGIRMLKMDLINNLTND